MLSLHSLSWYTPPDWGELVGDALLSLDPVQPIASIEASKTKKIRDIYFFK